MIREREAKAQAGVPMLLILLVLLVADIMMLIWSIKYDQGLGVLAGVVLGTTVFIMLGGFFVVNPNVTAVITLFGKYIGSERRTGLWWINPFSSKKTVSVRVRNFESAKLKVNDHDGNPIEIAAVVVWRVVDSAEAIFQVDNYDNFVHVQTEAALRNLATSHPYDAHNDGQLSLRGNTQDVADQLKIEVQARLERAGVEVIESRISHLAYAPEIASAMLQRQQASAIVAARTKIVEGAVGMVEMALDELNKKGVVHLDEERKAAMVSNLLVVLCSNGHAQPVVNTGTLYQ